MGFTNLSLTNKVIKLTIVNLLTVRNTNQKELTTFPNNKMVCNKNTFVLVLVGLISVASMVSSAAVGKDDGSSTAVVPTTSKNVETSTSVTKTPPETSTSDKNAPTDSSGSPSTGSTASVDPSASTASVDPSASTASVDPSASTTEKSGAGCPKLTYGMLFSVIS